MRTVCLAFSFSRGGICIAGISDEGQWVRPVNGDETGWDRGRLEGLGLTGLRPQYFSFEGGTPTPEGRFSEDYMLTDEELGAATIADIDDAVLEEVLSNEAETRGAGLSPDRSLWAFRLNQGQFFSGERRSAGFRYGLRRHGLPTDAIVWVTSTAFPPWATQNLGEGEFPIEAVLEAAEAEQAYIVLSHGKPFGSGRSYPLLAGIHLL